MCNWYADHKKSRSFNGKFYKCCTYRAKWHKNIKDIRKVNISVILPNQYYIILMEKVKETIRNLKILRKTLSKRFLRDKKIDRLQKIF